MDIQLFQFINSFAGRREFIDMLAIFFAKYSEYVLLGVLFVLFFLYRKHWSWRILAAALGAAVVSRFVLTEIIRFFYDRPRPFEVLEVVQLIAHGPEASFPSGHAAFYFALSWFLFFWNKKIGTLFLIFTVLMTFGRVFTGIHYPADILGGFVVGLLCALGTYCFYIKRGFQK